MWRGKWIPLQEHPPTEEDGPFVLMWHIWQGVMLCRSAEWNHNRFFRYWRPMPAIGWVDAAERKPERKDADSFNCVLAVHRLEGFKVTGWRRFDTDRNLTRWMATPEPPEDYKELRWKDGY